MYPVYRNKYRTNICEAFQEVWTVKMTSHVYVALKIFSVYGSPYICEQILYILHMKKAQTVIL
jgi:hypothetical protein